MLASVPIRDELKKVMREQGISQNRLAKMCQEKGISIAQNELSEFLSGKRNFTTDKLDSIAKILGTSWRLPNPKKKE